MLAHLNKKVNSTKKPLINKGFLASESTPFHHRHKIIVILGPTASGKSDLAVKIAKKYSGEIISADSRQIYKGLNIGSGKITKKEMRGIPHHLLDVVSPKRTFTVAKYQKLARKKIERIWQHGKIPIICGGTGFYIDAVLNNYPLPEIKPDWKLRKKLEKKSTGELFANLKKLDPRRAKKIDRHNKRRLVRALEIIAALGQVPKLKANPFKADILMIGINKKPKILKKLIEKRLLKRLKRGMITEVKKLRASGLSWKRLENFGLEYRYVAQFLQGKITKEAMTDILLRESWHYAKRQMTWFKRDKRTNWIQNQNQAIKLSKKFLKKFS